MKVFILVVFFSFFLKEAFGEPMIIHIEEGDLYIDIGWEDGVEVGKEFEIYRKTKKPLFHPLTKENLGHRLKRVGRLRIKWVGDKFSIADPIFCMEGEEIKIMDILVPCLEKKPTRPSYGGILKVGLIHEPLSLDPLKIRSQREILLVRCLYDTLVREGEDGKLLPSLAKRWEIKEDGLSIYVYLDRDVRFHDNRPLRAWDVKYTIERLLRSPWSRMFEKINNIEVVQDDVVMIKLSSKDPFLMKKLTYPIASILPKEVEEDFFADPVGTGPFRFKRWEKGEEIILHSNKEYFRERPFVDGVTFSIFKDEETALLEFETGWIDLLLLPQQEVRRFQQNIRWKDCIIQNKEKTVHLLLINETLPQNLFDAIKLAIDKRTIVDLFLKGTYHTTETPPPHKPEVAKELAKEASVRKELSLLVVDGAKMPLRIAKKVERDLFGIGLLLKMEKVNWSVFIKRIDAGRYDLAYTTFDSSFLYELYSKKRAIELFRLNTYIIHQPYLYNLKEDRSFEKVWLLR